MGRAIRKREIWVGGAGEDDDDADDDDDALDVSATPLGREASYGTTRRGWSRRQTQGKLESAAGFPGTLRRRERTPRLGASPDEVVGALIDALAPERDIVLVLVPPVVTITAMASPGAGEVKKIFISRKSLEDAISPPPIPSNPEDLFESRKRL